MKLMNILYVLLLVGQFVWCAEGVGALPQCKKQPNLEGSPKPNKTDDDYDRQLIKGMLEATPCGAYAAQMLPRSMQTDVLFQPLLNAYRELKARDDSRSSLLAELNACHSYLAAILPKPTESNQFDIKIAAQLLQQQLELFQSKRDEHIAQVKLFHSQGLARLLKGFKDPEKGVLETFVRDRQIILSHFGGVLFFPIVHFKTSISVGEPSPNDCFDRKTQEILSSNSENQQISYIILGMLANRDVIKVSDLASTMHTNVLIVLHWIERMKAQIVSKEILTINKMPEQEINFWDFIETKQTQSANGHVDLNVKQVTVDQGGSSSTTA